MRVDVLNLELRVGHDHKVFDHLGKVVVAETEVAQRQLFCQLEKKQSRRLQIEVEKLLVLTLQDLGLDKHLVACSHAKHCQPEPNQDRLVVVVKVEYRDLMVSLVQEASSLLRLEVGAVVVVRRQRSHLGDAAQLALLEPLSTMAKELALPIDVGVQFGERVLAIVEDENVL